MPQSPNRREFLQIVAAGLAYSGSAVGQSVAAAFRSPYLQNVRGDRATVCWTAATPGDGQVEYWDDSRTIHTVQASVNAYADGFRFEAMLENLAPASSYGYRASVDGTLTGVARFQTPGIPAFEFLAFGDSGTGSEIQAKLSRQMVHHSASFVVHTGDLVYPAGTYERYESLYFAYYQDLMRNAPLFPCPGNHDYYEARCLPYRALHSMPGDTVQPQDQGRYYSFDWGNAHVVSLDTNDSLTEAVSGSGDMLRWLDADLAASHKFWRIVVLHHSAYASGVHSQELEGQVIREHISPILEKYAVPLVLNGHEHSYQRSIPIRGVTYVTTGGGGAPLHPVFPSPLIEKAASEHHYLALAVDGGRLRLRALRADGSELDVWALSPPPVVHAVVDAASFGPLLAAGGLVSIFGHHLAADDSLAAAGKVTLNGKPLPILMSSASQINLQLLQDITGEATLVVHAPNGSVTQTVTIESVAPAIFEGSVIGASGTPVCAASPASPGETLSVYLTGLGKSTADIAVEWDGTRIAPIDASAVAGVPGVSVVTFTAPSAPFAEAQLRIVAAGKRSNAVTVPGI